MLVLDVVTRCLLNANHNFPGRREGYYIDASGNRSTALVLRRNLA